MPPHVHTNFRGPPSWLWRKCNRILRMGPPWGAVTLSRWCEGWYIGRWGVRRGLKSRSTSYPDHGHHWDPHPTRKIPMVEPGIETGTSWLVVRISEKGIEYKMCCLIFSSNFVWSSSHYKEKWARYFYKCTFCKSYITYRSFLSDFTAS